MSPEPKPRSMAAVTIDTVRPTCSSENKSGYLLENPANLPVLALDSGQ